MCELTRSDIECIELTLEDLHDPDSCEGCSECSTALEKLDRDCFDSETVMLSIGYAEVNRDGSVMVNGVVIHQHDVPEKR